MLLQALNILENFDSASLGYNSTRYIHTLYQAMNLAFADRDFYYGDPYYPPDEPGSADQCLAYDPAGHEGFTRQLVAAALRRHRG